MQNRFIAFKAKKKPFVRELQQRVLSRILTVFHGRLYVLTLFLARKDTDFNLYYIIIMYFF